MLTTGGFVDGTNSVAGRKRNVPSRNMNVCCMVPLCPSTGMVNPDNLQAGELSSGRPTDFRVGSIDFQQSFFFFQREKNWL